MNPHLRNKVNRKELKAKIEKDSTKRTTISFYKYVNLSKLENLRDELYSAWSKLDMLGRIYIAPEGINAQFSIPTENIEKLRVDLESRPEFKNIPFKIAVEDDGKSFYKLTLKIREKIVADGLDDESFDTSNTGQHLDAENFNKAIEEGAIVVDMRNHYESEIGHFENAICPDSETFREELPMVEEILKEKTAGDKNKKILFYCTGGIRCEKASAYFKHKGYNDVNQLHGGIIEYAHQVKAKGLPNKFRGKNFVFDERTAERISDEIIANCHQCEAAADTHTNCKNDLCHLLFIQCKSCAENFSGCCSEKCKNISHLPKEEQEKYRPEFQDSKFGGMAVFNKRKFHSLNAN